MKKTKDNIFLGNNFTDSLSYKPKGGGGVESNYPIRTNQFEHGSRLRREFESSLKEAAEENEKKYRKARNGFYLSVNGKEHYELAVKSLDNQKDWCTILLNVRDENNETSATVYVPFKKSQTFLRKIDAYLRTASKNEKPDNNDLIRSIERIKRANLESFWTDTPDSIPQLRKVDCEIWLRTINRNKTEKSSNNALSEEEKVFAACCNHLGIKVEDTRICFPERVVKLVSADGMQLEELVQECDYIAEIRKASFPISFIADEDKAQQEVYAEELLGRTTFEDCGVSVCVLDGGVNQEHPLLSPAMDNDAMLTVRPEWGKSELGLGHGTEMAGIALYGDLRTALENRENIVIAHTLESVKIISNRSENPPELYGDITKRAVALAEIVHPDRRRVNCMAVTCSESKYNSGVPSSWSAAIDSLVSGAEDDGKRLFLISAGNVKQEELKIQAYPLSSINHPAEEPAEAWNAVTVGGFTEEITISDDKLRAFRPIADKGELSPVSASSMLWDKKWPIKPEVLFEGGNYITDDTMIDVCHDTSVLTTKHEIRNRLFTTMSGTSPATAEASWFCARLMSRYPKLWPESVRALMIHSAEWTVAMRRQFLESGANKKGDYNTILRSCGYGVPNLSRAIECMNNHVNMIIQAEMKPYRKKSSDIVMNEMNIHNLPWPKEEMKRLYSSKARIKVTLSYFIEPFPSERGWKDRYCYQSCGLRFDVNKPQETLREFEKRINKLMSEADGKKHSSNSGIKWTLGPKNRDKGSVHSDYTSDYAAADLADCNYIAVYPVGGWWKTRKGLEKYDKTIRYSLIVTLSTPETECDLYTPIVNQIESGVATETPVAP